MASIRRALLSVSDKSGIVELARGLAESGIEILSTGGTAREIAAAGVTVKAVGAHTGFPEIMGGRVKTLHPAIHGGLLGRRGTDDAVMAEHDIDPIDLLVVNLYPFEAVIAQPASGFSTAIENIDIGGPAMLRAAAKNHASVVAVVDPDDYAMLLESLAAGGPDEVARRLLAYKAFAHTAGYDAAIADFLARSLPRAADADFPQRHLARFDKVADLRYGENPHQRAAFYAATGSLEASVAGAEQRQGKQLSFNNIADADAALECVKQFYEPACVIVKHANPCGVALGDNIREAYHSAYATDPTSAFGGIIAFNRSVDATTAEEILAQQFVEVLIAPECDDDALAVLANKPNLRVLTTGWWNMEPQPGLDYKKVTGGLLVQDRDTGLLVEQDLTTVTNRRPTENEVLDLLFAWKVCKFVKSNAIVMAKDLKTVGIGAGQMSRVYSTRIAAIKAQDAGLTTYGAVLASDAFFPFRDGLDGAAEYGISAVVQPGGSKRDGEVIEAANEHGIAMVLTGMRHFRH